MKLDSATKDYFRVQIVFFSSSWELELFYYTVNLAKKIKVTDRKKTIWKQMSEILKY
jgi:hypothetical protein